MDFFLKFFFLLSLLLQSSTTYLPAEKVQLGKGSIEITLILLLLSNSVSSHNETTNLTEILLSPLLLFFSSCSFFLLVSIFPTFHLPSHTLSYYFGAETFFTFLCPEIHTQDYWFPIWKLVCLGKLCWKGHTTRKHYLFPPTPSSIFVASWGL